MEERETHTIDASGKSLGRLATEVATLLRGKHKPNYVPYHDKGDYVVVKNFSQVYISGNKASQKRYYRHSGHPGGLKEVSFEKMWREQPVTVLRKAVRGMLPDTKLRAEQMKRLKTEL